MTAVSPAENRVPIRPFDAAAWGFASLPQRLAEAVADQQKRNALLAMRLLLLIPTILLVLYLLSPRAMDAMGLVRPVPAVLMVFIIVGGIRCWLLPVVGVSSAWLTLSVVLDFVLLYGLIYLLHWQYHLPLAQVLKAPTLFYAFVLIGVRALWFDPRYVLLSGATAGIGWAMMMLLALAQPGTTRTRDFSEYLTGNVVLVGAEMDKIVALLLFTATLATAIASARAQMIAAARSQTINQDLSQFFAPGVADQIAGREQQPMAGEGEPREGAVLIVDIRNFTGLAASLGPAATLAVLAAFHRRLAAVVDAHGGAIDKFLGDGALITFGCVQASGTAARDALACAVALAEEMARWHDKRLGADRVPVRTGIGVAAGSLIVGTIGNATRLEFTVIGDAANRAAKLEKHNKVLGTAALTDAASLALARAQGFSGEPAGMRPAESVAGLAEPVDVAILA
jgi:adenylate cyclase